MVARSVSLWSPVREMIAVRFSMYNEADCTVHIFTNLINETTNHAREGEHNVMDFSLNEEQLAIRDTCREFAEQEIKPRAEEMDRTGAFPYALIQKMGALGLLGLPFPEAYGGA